MAGCWPSSLFREKHEKGTGLMSSHLDRTSLVNKGFIVSIYRKYLALF